VAVVSGRGRQGFVLVLGHDTNGPDETQQFPSDSGHDLRFVFPLRNSSRLAAMQTMPRFPGDLFPFLGEVGLSFQKVASEPRSELIGPCSFDHDASQMSRLLSSIEESMSYNTWSAIKCVLT
jgi:hypothetical protein